MNGLSETKVDGESELSSSMLFQNTGSAFLMQIAHSK